MIILSQGDDSTIPMPTVFIFVPSIPIVVNQNTHQGLKLVNSTNYTTLNIILDKTPPGHHINTDTIIHFSPPAGILLASDTTKDLHFVSIPPGTILLTPISEKIKCQKKRP